MASHLQRLEAVIAAKGASTKYCAKAVNTLVMGFLFGFVCLYVCLGGGGCYSLKTNFSCCLYWVLGVI